MARRTRAKPASKRHADYTQLRNRFPKAEVFSADELAHIHASALRVLSELGIKVLLPEGRALFKQAGARVDEDTMMVFLDPDMVEKHIAKAPAEFSLRTDNPKRTIHMGGNHVNFSPAGGCPNVTDMTRGRRPGDMESFRDLMKLSQEWDVIAKLSSSIEPQDIPVHIRHYATMRAQLELSDKLPFIYARGHRQVVDGFEMLALARGLDIEDLPNHLLTQTVINSNSPRQLDIPMTRGIIDFATYGQPIVMTPFCLSGAMAPITIAGALTLSHAEALAGITLAQIVKPGVPVIYGAFSSNVDMKSGAPAFGTPEHFKTNIGAGQLARLINIPWRSGAGSASNAPDAQSTYENMMGLMGALMGHSHVVYHAAGWLEGGLTVSYEKWVIDCEILQGLAEAMQDVPVDDAHIGFDAIAQVQPGGHFFETTQTMERYQDAFYSPFLSDLSNFGQWVENGSKTATQRAHEIWQQKLKDFQPPAFPQDRMEAIDAFIARRTEEGGAPIDE